MYVMDNEGSEITLDRILRTQLIIMHQYDHPTWTLASDIDDEDDKPYCMNYRYINKGDGVFELNYHCTTDVCPACGLRGPVDRHVIGKNKEGEPKYSCGKPRKIPAKILLGELLEVEDDDCVEIEFIRTSER